MAFDQQEWNMRQFRRQQEREKRERVRKQLALRLIIAGIVLVGVVVLALVLGGVFDRREPVQPQNTTAAPDPTQESTAPLDPQTVITFAAAGDVNITDKVVASGGIMLDYNPIFQDVVSLLADADRRPLRQ